LFDRAENVSEPGKPCRRLGVVRIGLPFRLADQVTNRLPHRRLSDKIAVGVGIRFPALAFEDPTGLAAAGVVARARDRLAERNVFGVLGGLGQGSQVGGAAVGPFQAREIEPPNPHCRKALLAAPGARTLVKRGADAERDVNTRAGIADLRAGYEWRAVAEARGRCRAASNLRHVLIDLANPLRTGPQTLPPSADHAGV